MRDPWWTLSQNGNRFNQINVTRIEPKPGPANEGVDCLYGDGVRSIEAGRRPAAQPHPRLPDVIQRQRERRAFQLGQKFVSHILPVLAQRPFKPAFQTVPPCPPFLVAVEFKTALGVPGQLLAERFPKDCSSPRNSSAWIRSWPLRRSRSSARAFSTLNG